MKVRARKPYILFEAYQWFKETPGDYPLISGASKGFNPELDLCFIELNNKLELIKDGDWIVSFSDTFFRVYDTETFHKMYEEIEEYKND